MSDCWALLLLKIPGLPLAYPMPNPKAVPEAEFEHHVVAASRVLTDFGMVQTVVVAVVVGER